MEEEQRRGLAFDREHLCNFQELGNAEILLIISSAECAIVKDSAQLFWIRTDGIEISIIRLRDIKERRIIFYQNTRVVEVGFFQDASSSVGETQCRRYCNGLHVRWPSFFFFWL